MALQLIILHSNDIRLPTILREALEEHLATHRLADVQPGRLEA